MNTLYIHVPFCRRKCPYCDFFSVEDASDFLEKYPRLLIQNLRVACETGWWHGPFDTVFFGGGTPTLLNPAQVESILGAVHELFGVESDAEISMEANPGTVTPASLLGYRHAGVNRLSLGVQSFRDENLRLLGRIHSVQDAIDAFSWARQAGFDNVGFDLIFALPGQGRASLLDELKRVVELGPEHISLYGLTVEEGTPFYHMHRAGGLFLPEEDQYAQMFTALHDYLEGNGYLHYEISNYARPGFDCRHNKAYWHRRSCLGIGAGAHSFVDKGWGMRQAVQADLAGYEQALEQGKDPLQTLETFDRKGAMSETLYLGLRTAEGVDEGMFRARFGVGVAEAFPEEVRRLAGHLSLCDGCWKMDLGGWLLYDHFIKAFL